jgi:hypothetical protein
MFYLILAIDFLLLGLVVVFVIRLARASPEKRKEMLRPSRKTILIFAGTIVAVFLISGAVIFSFFGTIGICATLATRDYLKGQFGPRDSWSIALSEHIERSKKPAAGVYQIHYQYGEKEGSLVAEYFEQDGKLVFKITPKDK